MQPPIRTRAEPWPALPYGNWKDSCTTLHLWTQIVGKIRLAQTPWTNHSWHVTLYVTPRGLTTSPIPYDGRAFRIDFDFIDHALLIETSEGEARRLALAPRSVAEFHDELLAALAELDLRVRIHGSPNEVANPIPFRDDREHAAYDPDYAERFWRVLLQADRVFKQFRTRFRGKVSPAHFFWGSFDHASLTLKPTEPGRPGCGTAVVRPAARSAGHGGSRMEVVLARRRSGCGSSASVVAQAVPVGRPPLVGEQVVEGIGAVRGQGASGLRLLLIEKRELGIAARPSI
jgi:Family of unknown function (DUF5996)